MSTPTSGGLPGTAVWAQHPVLNSPLHCTEQGGASLVVEGDDEAGSWQVWIVAYRGAPATPKSRSVSPTLSTSTCWGNASRISVREENNMLKPETAQWRCSKGAQNTSTAAGKGK